MINVSDGPGDSQMEMLVMLWPSIQGIDRTFHQYSYYQAPVSRIKYQQEVIQTPLVRNPSTLSRHRVLRDQET